MALKEYTPGTAFPGVIGRTFDVSSPSLAPTAARQGRRTQRFVHCAGRHWLRPVGLLWKPYRNAEPRRAGERRPALQQYAHHGAVFADPVLHTDRAQPSLQRHVLHHRGVHGLSVRKRKHPVRERVPLRDAAPARL